MLLRDSELFKRLLEGILAEGFALSLKLGYPNLSFLDYVGLLLGFARLLIQFCLGL